MGPAVAANTKIEWCDHTFNPWIGCTRISPGCDHCYAEATMGQSRLRMATWGGPGTRAQLVLTSAGIWRHPRCWDRAAAKAGTRPRVFCASLADVFDTDAPVQWREALWDLVHETPHLEWLILTKRPQNIARLLPGDWGPGWPNVRLGVSVENQEEADRRIPRLLDVPHGLAPFISAEPLLGPVCLHGLPGGPQDDEDVRINALSGYYVTSPREEYGTPMQAIGWVIIGGESGRQARPCDVQCIRDLVAQCRAAGVPCFVKQLGAQPVCRVQRPLADGYGGDYAPGWASQDVPMAMTHPKGGDPAEWPDHLRVREFPA